MKYIERNLPLTKIVQDDRLLPTHVSLYLALLFIWQRNASSKSFNITRKELMSAGKIASTATYHKCLKELVKYGYIRYEPSYNYYKGSLIHLIT